MRVIPSGTVTTEALPVYFANTCPLEILKSESVALQLPTNPIIRQTSNAAQIIFFFKTKTPPFSSFSILPEENGKFNEIFLPSTGFLLRKSLLSAA